MAKERKREGLEGGSWSQKRGRMERTNTPRERSMCTVRGTSVCTRRGRRPRGEMQPMHFTGACPVLDFASGSAPCSRE